jgi:hypothetical protein
VPAAGCPAHRSCTLLASLIVSMLAATSAPTALYAICWARWGFSSVTTAVAFGMYGLSVPAGLLTVGGYPTTSAADRSYWPRSQPRPDYSEVSSESIQRSRRRPSRDISAGSLRAWVSTAVPW